MFKVSFPLIWRSRSLMIKLHDAWRRKNRAKPVVLFCLRFSVCLEILRCYVKRIFFLVERAKKSSELPWWINNCRVALPSSKRDSAWINICEPKFLFSCLSSLFQVCQNQIVSSTSHRHSRWSHFHLSWRWKYVKSLFFIHFELYCKNKAVKVSRNAVSMAHGDRR